MKTRDRLLLATALACVALCVPALFAGIAVMWTAYGRGWPLDATGRAVIILVSAIFLLVLGLVLEVRSRSQ